MTTMNIVTKPRLVLEERSAHLFLDIVLDGVFLGSVTVVSAIITYDGANTPIAKVEQAHRHFKSRVRQIKAIADGSLPLSMLDP